MTFRLTVLAASRASASRACGNSEARQTAAQCSSAACTAATRDHLSSGALPIRPIWCDHLGHLGRELRIQRITFVGGIANQPFGDGASQSGRPVLARPGFLYTAKHSQRMRQQRMDWYQGHRGKARAPFFPCAPCPERYSVMTRGDQVRGVKIAVGKRTQP